MTDVPESIFIQPWWLDAVAPGCWDEVRITNGEKIVARLPYVFRKTPLGRVLHMPSLTQHLGPWMDLGSGKQTKRIARNKELITQLIDGLPQFVSFNQHFHYSIENWTPFYWKGFEQTTRYTYVLEDVSSLDQVWERFDSNLRKSIRKAERSIVVDASEDADVFQKLNERVFARQGIKVPYSKELYYRLNDILVQRGRRKMFLAKDSDGRPHAAAYIVWDDHSAYYLMGGSDPDLRGSAATSLCMWHAIQFAASKGLKFDFEGSMLEPVEKFIRSFGGVPKPYHQVSKATNFYSMVKAIRRTMKWALGRSV